jgi:hypothetical protein
VQMVGTQFAAPESADECLQRQCARGRSPVRSFNGGAVRIVHGRQSCQNGRNRKQKKHPANLYGWRHNFSPIWRCHSQTRLASSMRSANVWLRYRKIVRIGRSGLVIFAQNCNSSVPHRSYRVIQTRSTASASICHGLCLKENRPGAHEWRE